MHYTLYFNNGQTNYILNEIIHTIQYKVLIFIITVEAEHSLMNLEQVQLMEKITRKLSEAFKETNQLCLEFISKHNKSMSLKQEQIKKYQQPQNTLNKNHQYEIKPKQQKIKSKVQMNPGYKSQQAKYEIIDQKPKKPLSPFFAFLSENRKKIKQMQAGMNNAQITKVMSSIWGDLDPNQKQNYHNNFQTQKILYDKKMSMYLHQHPEQKNKIKKRKIQEIQKDWNQDMKLISGTDQSAYSIKKKQEAKQNKKNNKGQVQIIADSSSDMNASL